MTTVSGQTQPEESRVGGYRLMARIGEGGMGVVHLAQAPDGTRVALKVLRPHIIGDSEARERLAREVNSLRLISSPRIAEVLDADPYGPTPYVATRYVPGLSLHEHVREEGAIQGADLLHFASSLAQALIAVHAVGVLHRDIKPSNVLMEGRSPVLIDFGLARLAEDPRLTHTGWLLGTPGYLAPEILYGDEASPASDVHAWAATVVFAATGRPPYGKGPAMAIMDRVRRGEHDLSAVPQPLRDLLHDCLAAEPLERPSIHEIQAWLGTQLAGAGAAASVAPEPWTMPVAAMSREPRTAVAPVAPMAPMASSVPAETPAADAPTVVEPVAGLPRPGAFVPASFDPAGEPAGAPATRVFPSGRAAGPAPDRGSPPVPYDGGSRAQRRGQLLGLGAAVSAAVAFAPYGALLLVGATVLVLRTASVARERHTRRRLIRGRARWYDVPATTLSTPGYLVLALFGALLLLAWATGAAIAVGTVAAILGAPLRLGMLLAGLGFTGALWWGPAAGRLRETTVAMTTRWSRGEWAGLFVIGASLLVSVVLLGALVGSGPSWSPNPSAPWSHGFLAQVAAHL